MFEDDEWKIFREDCLRAAHERNDSIVREWLNKIGYHEIVGYYLDILGHVMEIYTKHPGILIGKAGCHVADLQKTLSDEFGGIWNIKFIEVRGGFVICA